MPALTRRRDPAAHDETWLIHYDDVHVGTIRMRTGVPTNVDQWGWTIGFYPASHRGLRASGIRPKDGSGDEDGGANFHDQKRKNVTHASTTDPDSRLYRKAAGR